MGECVNLGPVAFSPLLGIGPSDWQVWVYRAHMVLLTAAVVQSATKAGRHSDTRIQPTNGTHPLQRV